MQKEVIQEFSNLQSSLEKYEYLLDLGKKLQCEEWIKKEQYALKGCQSQVWIHAEEIECKVHFRADSDSLILRGVLALLLRVLDHQKADDIIGANLFFLKEIGLESGFSPSRANGVSTIVNSIRGICEQFVRSDN